MKECIVFEVPAGLAYAERNASGTYDLVDCDGVRSTENVVSLGPGIFSSDTPSQKIQPYNKEWVTVTLFYNSCDVVYGPFKVVQQYQE